MHPPLVAGRGQQPAVGGEGQRTHRIRVAAEDEHGLPRQGDFFRGRTLTSLNHTTSPGSWVCRPTYPAFGRAGSHFGSYHCRRLATSALSESKRVTRLPSRSTSTTLPRRVMTMVRHSPLR